MKASTRIVPWMNSVGWSTATAPCGVDVPGAAADRHDNRQHEGAGQAAERDGKVQGTAQRPGRERLNEHPCHGRSEHEQHRRELAVLDVRRGDGRRGRAERVYRTSDPRDPRQPVTACSRSCAPRR